MRSAVVILVVILVGGCSQPQVDPLADRGQLPEDIDAPPPTDEHDDDGVFVESPNGLFVIAGHVLDVAGRPLAGIQVWIEGADLRERDDNLDLYEQIRAATMTHTGADGAFRFELEGGLYSVIANADGWLPRRSDAVELAEEPRQLELVLVRDLVRIAAHRGASYYAPENTLPAIGKAQWLGAHAVEMDVRLTADGESVMFHDPWLNRTTGHDGLVDLTDWPFMAALEAGSWFDARFAGTPIPTLRQALAATAAAGLEIILDIKASPERAAATREVVADEVRAAGAEGHAVLAAFRKASVAHCVHQGLRCAYISNGTSDGWESLATTHDLGASMLLLNQTFVVSGLATQAEAWGIRLYAWTANEEHEWDVLLSLGVHGILTDRPAFLAEALAQRLEG